MKKNQIIKKNEDFSIILSEGKRVKNNYYSIYYKESKNNLFGISIPTKTGKAVVRNKIKRQLKNIIDHNKNYIQTGYDYVIIVRRSILELDFKERETQFMELMKKIGEKNEKK